MIVRTETGQNSLYIMNDDNEVVVDNKKFDNIITGVAIGDKSEGYSLITLNFEKGIPENTLYFNLLDDVELWSVTIENELLVKTQIVNNNVIAIGDKNIYYYNTNGKLMWKNRIYSKISDIEIDKDNQRIYMFYEHDDKTELITYSFEGRVMEVKNAPVNMKNLEVVENKILVSNDNAIYIIHGSKLDKIFEDTKDRIEDYVLEGSAIRILFKDKLVSGLIK
jgi:outer membrane protein assembly factor BamB